MTYKPTAEQQVILDFVKEQPSNLLISALAGAAKTTTLSMIAQAHPNIKTLYLAFNKRVVKEIQPHLPEKYECKTFNALGHAAWVFKCTTRLKLITSKNYNILKALNIKNSFPLLLRSMRIAKSSGHIPDSFLEQNPKILRLMDDETLRESLDENLSELSFNLLIEALEISFQEAQKGIIDFDDQILMPVALRAPFPFFTTIMVDEAQDLSPLNHLTLSLLVRKRLIAVGDQYQAIYAFRGAHEEGMQSLKKQFNMQELTLSTSFRCPSVIVKHVQNRAPTMKAHKEGGTIQTLQKWKTTILPENCAVICSLNAPLVKVAIELLSNNQRPKMWGNDVTVGLVKQLQQLGGEHSSPRETLTALDIYQEKQEKKVQNKKLLADKIQCLYLLISSAPTLGKSIEKLEYIMKMEGLINLTTGHKAKGHEFNEVFFLDQHLIGVEGQDPNLRYVICTRTRQNLTYITSEGLNK